MLIKKRMMSQTWVVGYIMKTNATPEGASLGGSARGKAKMNLLEPTVEGVPR